MERAKYESGATKKTYKYTTRKKTKQPKQCEENICLVKFSMLI